MTSAKESELSPRGGSDSHNDELNKQIKDANSKLKTTVAGIEQAHVKTENDRESILNLYEKITKEGGKNLSNYHRSKLKTIYNSSLKNCVNEQQKLKECLEQLSALRKYKEEKRHQLRKQQQQLSTPIASGLLTGGSSSGGGTALRRGALMMLLQKAAANLKLWLDSEEPAPPLCGAVPAPANHVCEPGDLVAARVKGADGDENWILAEVKLYDSASGRYDIEDIDEEQKERYTLSKKKIIPLPHYRAHPQLNPEAIFDLQAVVWALYPQTTCFYKGVVERRPQGPNDDYLVAFEDSSFVTGFSPPLAVPQRYVVAK